MAKARTEKCHPCKHEIHKRTNSPRLFWNKDERGYNYNIFIVYTTRPIFRAYNGFLQSNVFDCHFNQLHQAMKPNSRGKIAPERITPRRVFFVGEKSCLRSISKYDIYDIHLWVCFKGVNCIRLGAKYDLPSKVFFLSPMNMIQHAVF